MQSFEWSLHTNIKFGLGRFSKTQKYLKGYGKRALIVTSKSFAKGGARAAVLDALLAQLKNIGVEATIFSEVEPNPRTSTIDRAGNVAKETGSKFVIALGGGSVMDAAKCI